MTSFLLDGGSTHADHAEVRTAIAEAVAAGGCKITVKSVNERTARQNRMLHATTDDIARCVEWCGRKLTGRQWKRIFSANIKKQEVINGLDGELVVIGTETSEMSRRLFADLITLAIAFGNERGVKWRHPDWENQVSMYLKENHLA